VQEPLAEQLTQELLLIVFTQAIWLPVSKTIPSSVATSKPSVFYSNRSRFTVDGLQTDNRKP